jgi:long-chain-fatty-acid---luciferin-component ligase
LIDSIVFGDQEWLDLSHGEQRELTLQLVRESFAWHLESCPLYAAFAAKFGVTRESLQEESDLYRIPQFSTAIFKRQHLTSVPLDDMTSSFASSGTLGARSVIHRDATTLHRLCGPIRPDSPLFGDFLDGMDETNSVILNLGPSRGEAGQVWFAYVMSLFEQAAPMRNYVVDSRLLLDQAVEDTCQYLGDRDRVFLIGPPFLVHDFCRTFEADSRSVSGGDRLFVFTGGGWKGREYERIDREAFDQRVMSALGIRDRARIRDVFNQVELNTLLVECDRHYKHVPPWVHAFARDPRTFEPLKSGEVGVLCFSDATAHSYPCFIIGDDLGRVSTGTCECGRDGVVVEFMRRLRGSSHGGCADTMRNTTHISTGHQLIGPQGHGPSRTLV